MKDKELIRDLKIVLSLLIQEVSQIDSRLTKLEKSKKKETKVKKQLKRI